MRSSSSVLVTQRSNLQDGKAHLFGQIERFRVGGYVREDEEAVEGDWKGDNAVNNEPSNDHLSNLS